MHRRLIERKTRYLSVDKVGGTPETRDAALVELRRFFLTPPPQREMEAWLAELSVITAKRADDEFTEQLRLKAYSERLADYPADVVREVLLKRTWRFWPAWAGLEEVCKDPRATTGAHILRAIETETEREEARAQEAARVEADAGTGIEADAAPGGKPRTPGQAAERAACQSDQGCADCIDPR